MNGLTCISNQPIDDILDYLSQKCELQFVV